jgi:putative salt-induced outer membrane protein YdiY
VPRSSTLVSSIFRLLLIALLCVPAARAVELHLKNGDRITGQLVGRENGHIVFRSPILGELRVPHDQAVVVDTPQTPVESLAGIPPSAATLPKPGTGATAVIADPSPKSPPWRGKMEFGFLQQTGRKDNVQVSLRADAERTAGPNSYRAEARALYGEQYEETTSDRYDGLFRWRHELGPRTFSQLQSSYTKDRVKLIDDNAEQNVGVGYRILQKPRHSGSIGVGVTAQYRRAVGVESGTNYLGELFEDYSYRLTGRLTITQDASILYSPDERSRYVSTGQGFIPTDDSATNYRLRFNSALQGKVSERVSLNLRFEYEFDNAILDPKAKVDQRLTTSIGYGF